MQQNFAVLHLGQDVTVLANLYGQTNPLPSSLRMVLCFCRHEQLIELYVAIGNVRMLGVGANVVQLQLAVPCLQASG